MADVRSVAVVIAGRVQGVAYRAWTEREASARGLAGHVRNREDGRVEAVFSGEPAAVEAMVQACWAGPAAPASRACPSRRRLRWNLPGSASGTTEPAARSERGDGHAGRSVSRAGKAL